MKILVLGGCGRQGSVITADLRRKYDVTTVDVSDAADIKADLSDLYELNKVMKGYDLVVGALPSALGFNAMSAAVNVGVDYVDVSFLDFDVSKFDELAKEKGITILHDCGLAPGLSHLVAGRAINSGADSVCIMVGGVSANRDEDYIITWSPEDLLEEYTRPARIIVDHNEVIVPALSDQIKVRVDGMEFDAFYSDGLRSLLSKRNAACNIEERTLRWPGHIKKVGPLIYSGDFAGGLKEMYRSGTDDLVVMRIDASDQNGVCDFATLTVRGNEEMSAMARTTALACSAFAQLVAENIVKDAGVIPPEDLANNDEAYVFVLMRMEENGVHFNEKYPFLGDL